MTRTLYRLFNGTVALFATAIVALAVLSIAARLLLPHADALREDLVARLGETLGAPVEVGALSIHLRGLSPELRFTEARLLASPASSEAPKEPLLAAHALRIELDPLASLAARRPRIAAVGLVGADIHARRDADGRLRIRGLDALQGDDAQALAFFLNEGRFRLLDSRLSWHDAGTAAPAQTLFVEVAEFVNQGRRHDLRVAARTADDRANRSRTADSGGPADETANQARFGELRILAKLEGPAAHPERWSGRLYLKAKGEDLASLIGERWPSLELHSSALRLESWNRLARGRLNESWTTIGIEGLRLEGDEARAALELGALSGRARWQRQAQGWRLDIQELRLPGSADSAPTSATLRYRRAPARNDAELARPVTPATAPADTADNAATPAPAARLFAAIGALPLGPLAEIGARLATDFPENLPVTLAEPVIAITQGRPRGLARNLAVHLELRSDPADAGFPALADWRLKGALEGLTIGASANANASASTSAKIPPFSGIDLDFDLGPTGGRARIDGRDARLDLRPLFAQPHRFTALHGAFAWRLMPAGSIHLWTQALRAETAHLATLTRLRLCVHPSGANPFIDLHTHLHDGDIEALAQWLPVGIMDERLQDWLLQAIVDARLESGDLVLRGPLERFPFDDHAGRFLLTLRLVDGVLDYGGAAPPAPAQTFQSTLAQAASPQPPGLRDAEDSEPLRWPPLREIAATLRFENRRLEVEIPSAEILNSQVDAGHLRLPDLWNPTSLEIEARGNGPLADGRHVLATSPLAKRLGGLASAIEVSGEGGIALRLGVPLSKERPFRYRGELRWEPIAESSTETNAGSDAEPTPPSPDETINARELRIRGTDLTFSDIEGRLRFDEQGIDADDIRANLGPQALAVAIETLDGGSDAARTEIGLEGQTPVARLAKALPSPLWRFASGKLDWRLGLGLRNRDAAHQTPPIDLRLSSELQGLALSLPAPLGKSAGEPRAFRLSGRYQDQWPLPLRIDSGELGALLEVDRAADGRIAPRRLAIDLNGQPEALPPAGSIEIGGALATLDLEPWLDWIARSDLASLQGDNAEERLQLLPLRLEVEDLRFQQLRWNDLEAVLEPREAGGWDIQFNAEQSGHGAIRLPASASQNPVHIRIERLDLAPLVEAREEEAAATAPADPRAFGRLDLEIERLHYGEDRLGRLRLMSVPQPNGVDFETLSLHGPHVDASARAQWHIDATDYVETTFELDANSTAIGELLRESGFYSALSGAAGELQLDLRWPGGPGDLSLARARGTLALEVGSGRMLDMEPGVGRMLGILNTAALSRRLSLDFSDLFADGFAFDRIHGEIAIGSGEARIRALDILAPPADIEITGRTDLVAGVLDQTVVVTPEIGIGLALASTLAGGPVVGAAVFLTDKVTDGAVERLGRYAYRVTGPWRDPLIRRVDTGGSPSVGNLFVDEDDADDEEEEAERTPTADPPNQAPPQRVQPSNPFLEGF